MAESPHEQEIKRHIPYAFWSLDARPLALAEHVARLEDFARSLWEAAEKVDTAANGLSPRDRHGKRNDSPTAEVAWQGPTATAYQDRRVALTGDRFGIKAVANLADQIADELREVAKLLTLSQDKLDALLDKLKANSTGSTQKNLGWDLRYMRYYEVANNSFVAQMESVRSSVFERLVKTDESLNAIRERLKFVSQLWGFSDHKRAQVGAASNSAEGQAKPGWIRISIGLVDDYRTNVIRKTTESLDRAATSLGLNRIAGGFGNEAPGAGARESFMKTWEAVVVAGGTLSMAFQSDDKVINEYLTAHRERAQTLGRSVDVRQTVRDPAIRELKRPGGLVLPK